MFGTQNEEYCNFYSESKHYESHSSRVKNFKECSERQVKLWRVARLQFKKRIRGRYLKQLMRRAKNEDCCSLNATQTEARYLEAKAALENSKPHADEFRKEHLKQLAKAIALENDTNEESELKKLTNQEQQRRRGLKLKTTSTKANKGLAAKFFTGPEGSDKIAVEDKVTSKELSAQVNEDRFTACLTASEFLTDPQLMQDVGIMCEGPAIDDILAGTYQPDQHFSWHTKTFLEHCEMPSEIKDNPMAPPKMTTQDHVRGSKRAKEHTASAPQTPDFSHWTSSAFEDHLTELDKALQEVPLVHGFAPDKWNPMAACAISKKENVLRADKSRTILLMDALWNSNNKWYGREFMNHNEAAGTIPEEQAGSCKFRRAAEVALKKVLSMDLMCQFKGAGFLCSNNAIQCYDRIIHCVAMLAMLRMGADKNAVTSLFGQLQQADHYVMTGYGLSEFSYGGQKRTEQGLLPMQGVMQGNGMGPIIWLAISVVLIQIMSSMGFGALFLAAITATQLQLMGFCFVDDTDLLHTAPDVATPATSCLQMFQAAIDCWEGCLRVTGGGFTLTNPSGAS